MDVSDKTLEALRALDTPTVCNALEIVAPERRGFGYTIRPLFCAAPELPPMVGFARTARIRAQHPPAASKSDQAYAKRSYYRYVAEGPKPSVVVIQDLDETPGYGSLWGEVNSNVHKGLGALGVITNGSVRDLGERADGFQFLAGMVGPSHAWVRVVDFGGTITVHGMAVADGDLVHADRHGAVIVPLEVADQVAGAADLIARREAVIITAAQARDFTIDKLERATKEAQAIER
ncbi:MAG: RraA family protein [Geminicoccaceae bacterium]